MTANYLALTIGPIYKTIEQSKKTRAVWAASYFFSWFMKQILKKAKDRKYNILLPYNVGVPYESQYGAGYYADRLYFTSGPTIADIENLKQEVINEIAKDFILNGIGPDIESVKAFLDNYLNVHIIELQSDGNNVLINLNRRLENKELRQNFVFENDKDLLLEYLSLKLIDDSILIVDAFGYKGREFNRFRSLPEISSTSLQRLESNAYKAVVNATYKYEDLEITNAIEKNETLSKYFKPHHKYCAIIYADGDNIGPLLEQVQKNQENLQEFSHQLLEFAKGAEAIIYDYGGAGIYLGGEDILAFAPLACIDAGKTVTNTIFDLIRDLDSCFAKTIGQYANGKVKVIPTLSYGIKIAYVKYPLKESMLKAHDLLEYKAKKTVGKNCVALRFQKHSGAYMECVLEKSKASSWNAIAAMIRKYTEPVLKPNSNNKSSKTEADKSYEILSGIIHRFIDELFFDTFYAALKGKRLTAFLANSFNEAIHKEHPFLKELQILSESVYGDYEDKAIVKDILYTVLRIIHFINSEKE